jgi:photosystem II stability/assembly factor-like uncharacterized protein
MLQATRIFKTALLFFLLMAGTGSYTQGTWERINVPTNQTLNSVCFVDSLYGWIAGDSGTILHTVNGGNTWITQDTHAAYDVEDVFFLNRNLGWASTFNYTSAPYGTIMLKTTNGGATWVSQPYPAEDLFMTCILFRDSLNGWMGGIPHALVKTTDGGITWTQAAIEPSIFASFPVLSIQFYNEQYGYASGGRFDIAGVIWHTSNGGDMWYAIDPADAPADEVHGLHLFDSVNVMGAGGDPDFGYGVGMIRTSDGGWNWNYDELDIQGNAYDLDFRNDHEAWAPLGPKRQLIYSMDTGVTWKVIVSPDTTAIYDMTFPDTLHGYAVGRDGAMLKYNPRIILQVDPVSPAKNKFVLHQNYPNPFNASTKIRYEVRSPGKNNYEAPVRPGSYVVIRVYDLMGDAVAVIRVTDLSPGEHELEFESKDLPDGIYFYQLQLTSAEKSVLLSPPKKFLLRH